MSALGQKRTFRSAIAHVRFTPNSDRESEFPQTVMSALGQKQTFAAQNGMSALPRKRTCAVQLGMSAMGQ